MMLRPLGFPSDLLVNGYLLEGSDVTMIARFPTVVDQHIRTLRSKATALKDQCTGDRAKKVRLLRWLESRWLDLRASAIEDATATDCPFGTEAIDMYRELRGESEARAHPDMWPLLVAILPEGHMLRSWYEGLPEVKTKCPDPERGVAPPPGPPEATCSPEVDGAQGPDETIAHRSRHTLQRVRIARQPEPASDPSAPLARQAEPMSAPSPTHSATAPGRQPAPPSAAVGGKRQGECAAAQPRKRPTQLAGVAPARGEATAGRVQVLAAGALPSAQVGVAGRGTTDGEPVRQGGTKRKASPSAPRGKSCKRGGKAPQASLGARAASDGEAEHNSDVLDSAGEPLQEKLPSPHQARVLVCDAWGWQIEATVGLNQLGRLHPQEQGSDIQIGVVLHKLMTKEASRDRDQMRISFLPTEVFAAAEGIGESPEERSAAPNLRRVQQWVEAFQPLQADVILCPVHVPGHFFLAAIFNPGTAYPTWKTCMTSPPAGSDRCECRQLPEAASRMDEREEEGHL